MRRGLARRRPRNELMATAETLARTMVAQHAADVDARARFPVESFAAIKAAGLLGLMVPEELWGEGAPASDITAICSILGRACAATGLIFAMHHMQVASLLNSSLDSAWHRGLLRRIATEQLLAGSATTEGGIGGDIRSSACAVVAHGDRITVEKRGTVISYGREADIVLLTARRSPQSPPSDQVLVALTREDFRLERTAAWDTLGMRGTCSETFHLIAEAGAEQICGRPFSEIVAQSMLPTSHLFWSGVWHGIAADAVGKAQSIVRTRARQAPGVEPSGARRLAVATRRLQIMRAGILDAGRLLSEAQSRAEGTGGSAFAIAMSNLKVVSSQLAIEIVHDAMQICGIAGYRNDGPHSLARHLRDATSAVVMINNDRIESNIASLMPISKHESSLIA